MVGERRRLMEEGKTRVRWKGEKIRKRERMGWDGMVARRGEGREGKDGKDGRTTEFALGRSFGWFVAADGESSQSSIRIGNN